MANLSFEIDGEHNPFFKLPTALDGRRLAISTKDEVVHPVRALATGASKFSSSLQQTVDALVASDSYTDATESSSSPILTAFESLCYTATELFDVYSQGVGTALNLAADKKAKERFRDYKGVVNKRRDTWAMICNKIKHNSNVLVPYRKTYKSDGFTVRGYALYQPAAHNQQFVNRTFHKAGEAFRSFDLSLRQMIFDVLKCDIAAAQLIASHADEEGAEPLATTKFPFRIGPQLRTLSNRPVYAGDREQVMFDGFDFEDGVLQLRRKKAVDRKGAANEVSAIFQADEIVNHFEFE